MSGNQAIALGVLAWFLFRPKSKKKTGGGDSLEITSGGFAGSDKVAAGGCYDSTGRAVPCEGGQSFAGLAPEFAKPCPTDERYPVA